jgi:hypothetical protein
MLFAKNEVIGLISLRRENDPLIDDPSQSWRLLAREFVTRGHKIRNAKFLRSCSLFQTHQASQVGGHFFEKVSCLFMSQFFEVFFV